MRQESRFSGLLAYSASSDAYGLVMDWSWKFGTQSRPPGPTAARMYCAHCGGELDHDAPPRTRRRPSVGHIKPLVDYPWLAFDPANLRVTLIGCNSPAVQLRTARASPADRRTTSALASPRRAVEVEELVKPTRVSLPANGSPAPAPFR
jgi:hypothetical protein